MGRLTFIRSLHGVGLVAFTLGKAQPDYTAAVLPAPDVLHVNSVQERLKASKPALLNKLL